jgi:hypothetical protein
VKEITHKTGTSSETKIDRKVLVFFIMISQKDEKENFRQKAGPSSLAGIEGRIRASCLNFK